MSSLTEQERIGLEEVFLSISTRNGSQGTLRKIKERIYLFLSMRAFLKKPKKPVALLFQRPKRIKIPNFHHLFPKKNKKKKNLS